MHRRAFLTFAGVALAGAAGCSGRSDGNGGSTDDGTPTGGSDGTPEDGTPTPTPDVAYDVDVSFDALQPGVVTPDSPDSIGVAPEGGQYLYLRAAVDGSDRPDREEFSFAFDGTQYSPRDVDTRWERTPWRIHSENAYGGESGAEPTDGWLLFELPETGDAGGSGLRWPGGGWTPDEVVAERLATPFPPFDVSVETPNRIAPGEQPWLRATVANRGDVPGGFVAALNRVGPRVAYAPVARVSLSVPAGERETWEWKPSGIDTRSPEGTPTASMELKLQWHDGRASRTVDIATETGRNGTSA